MSVTEGRIGALLFASHMGLGVLGRALYDNGVIDRVLVEPIRRHAVHREWYANAPLTASNEFETFIDNIDALLIVETASDWDIVSLAKQRGIPVTMMPMYEWSPTPPPVMPDRFLCPSLLDLDYYRDKGPARFLPVPVDVPWHERRRARVFVHNTGNVESAERNGTPELLAAIAKVKSKARFLIRMQHDLENTSNWKEFDARWGSLLEQAAKNPRVELVSQTVPFEELWIKGDVFIFPEKYNGLSLPLAEAYASGMLVMAGNRYPVNSWLPKAPLIPVHDYETREIEVVLESAVYQADTIARHIDDWFDTPIRSFSKAGRSWAREHSWDQFCEPYRKFILTGE